ncbi:MAG TPA: BON domain-containing protein [Pyrinomonadaceae bacterium]
MKFIRNFILMAFAVAMLSFVTVNAQTNVDSMSALEKKIRKEILMLPNYGLFDHIAFKVDDGTVTLYGKTASLGTMKGAERVVKRIPGVIEVVNNIDELPLSSFDNQIRRAVVGEFVRSGGVYPYISGVNPSVRIIVENGRVTLEGYVSNKGTSNLMYMLANRVPGTFGVTNNLVIAKSDA